MISSHTILHTFPNSDVCVFLHIELRYWLVWWSLVFSLSLFSPVLSQWSTPWTWSLWSTPWEDGRRTRSSSPAPTASACHLRLMRLTWRRKGSISSSWRVFSSTITSRSPRGLFVFLSHNLYNPSRTDLGLLFAPSGRWSTSTTSASTSPFLMRNANEEEGNQLPGQLWNSRLVRNRSLESDSTAYVCLQHKDIHSSWPPRPVWRPRLAHVLETQERDGEQLRQHR